MAVVFKRPESLLDVPFHYCPGCTHGIIHRLVAEVMDELEIQGKAIGVAPVGCAVMNYDYFACDMVEAPHGRAPAVATGIKRARPENVVFTYQGDGDLAAIGTAETVHAATRGENITVIFVNNAIYGMTGRTDGADLSAEPGDPDHALRQRRKRCRISCPCLRDAVDAGRRGSGTACYCRLCEER